MIDSEKLDEEFKKFFNDQNFTRLEKMFLLSLKPLVEKHQISDETAFILSTTKGNISLLKNQKLYRKAFFFQFSSKNC
jgi:3-oxoacyl-[acyl-carrier-protein] synthase-1